MGQFEAVFDGDSSSFNGEKCTQHLYNSLFFCLLRFSHVRYSTHEKYISLALEQQKQQNHSITTSLLFFSCQFNDVCAKSKI